MTMWIDMYTVADLSWSTVTASKTSPHADSTLVCSHCIVKGVAIMYGPISLEGGISGSNFCSYLIRVI